MGVGSSSFFNYISEIKSVIGIILDVGMRYAMGPYYFFHKN
jgi:hypothetical protein